MNRDEAEAELEQLLTSEVQDLARSKLLAFTLYTMPTYEVNWHHRVLCDYLDRFADGEISRLMVFMPPRNGKSELVSRRLPAYLLGRNPDLQLISASYSDSLASQMNRDVQRIMEEYQYSELFPNTKLGNSSKTAHGPGFLRNASTFEVVGRRGRYKSAGIGTGITGMGADLAIIDDPIKDQTEADSRTYRDRAWEWYTSTLYTRLEKGGSILLTMTRWHEDDLAGRLIQLAKDDPGADKWEVLSLPAVCEDGHNVDDIREPGEALWPNKYPLEKLNSIRSSSGSRVWNALFQQRPAPSEGSMISREWIKFYNQIPDVIDEWILSVDLTFKAIGVTDYTVINCWCRRGANIYLVDQIRAKMDFPAQMQAIRDMAAKYPKAFAKYIEEAANGAAVISLLKNEIMGMIPYRPMTSKEARLSAVSPLYESGNIYYPNPKLYPWVETNIKELLTFPNDVHDDTVDTATLAISQLGRVGSSAVKMAALNRW